MKEFLTELQSKINSLLSIHFYKKDGGVIEKLSNASYSVYLKEIIEADNKIALKFTNGMVNAGKSDFTVTFPTDSRCTKEGNSIWNIEYETEDSTLIVKVFFPEEIHEREKNSIINKPAVTEIKSPTGELERLIIETPDNGVDLQFITNEKIIITQLLNDWKSFTVESPDNSEEANATIYEFSTIEVVALPGNTFLEISATSPLGTTEIEVATSISINLKESSMYYTIDDVPFTLRKNK